jgi:hypothetical protein
MTITTARRVMAEPGRVGTALVVCCAAVRGASLRSGCVLPTATGMALISASTMSAFVWPGIYKPFYFFLLPFSSFVFWFLVLK